MPTSAGKTTAQTDSFQGRFVKLVPDTEVVQVVELETDDPTMKGEMTITYELADADDGTDLVGLHENLPPGVSPADDELGWRMSIDELAELVEGRWLAPPGLRRCGAPTATASGLVHHRGDGLAIRGEIE